MRYFLLNGLKTFEDYVIWALQLARASNIAFGIAKAVGSGLSE